MVTFWVFVSLYLFIFVCVLIHLHDTRGRGTSPMETTAMSIAWPVFVALEIRRKLREEVDAVE